MKGRPLFFPSSLAKVFNLRKGGKVLLAVAVLLLSGLVLAQSDGGHDLSWHTMGGGGGPMSSTSYALNGTMSQASIGPAESTNYDLGAGYWYGVVVQIGPFEIYLPLILKNY